MKATDKMTERRPGPGRARRKAENIVNFKQLEYFTDLAQTLNYTETARRLYVSQTAITKQIQNLEKELNAVLFHRTKKHVSLTAAGKIFYTEAQKILEQARSARKHLESFQRGEKGILKIGFLKDSDFEMMRNLVTGFHERYPDIRLELGGHIRKDLEDLLDSGELDVILNIDASDTPDFRKVFLKKFPLVAVVHRDHPLALEERICADDLKNLIYDIRQEKDGRPNFEMEGALLQVSCNLGEAIVNEFVIQQNIRPYVAVIPLKPDRGRDMYMMCHRNKYNPLISCFEDFLKTTFR